MKTNLFVSGPMRCGKSTILREAVEEANISVGGFFVQRLMFSGQTVAFRLVDAAREKYVPDVEIEVLEQGPALIGGYGDQMTWEWHPESLEVMGTNILNESLAEHRELVLMDELGRLELRAPSFMKTVFKVLDSSSAVLGVIKPESNWFLDAIRNRDDVRVLDLTRIGHREAAREVRDFLRNGAPIRK